MKKILIIGLPGAGKTTLALELQKKLKASWLNADKVRKKFNDWDFSRKGVLRQAKRMKSLAKKSKKNFVIADFICPYEEGRKIFKPDYLIWMNTIKRGRLSTFNKTFQKPKKFDFKINKKNAKFYSKIIIKKIKYLK
jgi:adenylylsulfate kinase